MKETYQSVKTLLKERKDLKSSISKIDRELWEIIKKFRLQLNKKTYSVLKKRIYEKKILKEVGKEIGVTTERVRQMEAKGIEQLEEIIKDYNNKTI